ncbi:TonB-dependent receptor [Steroidobacter sp.]|uniref:TonB-dependent receptor n=1 Tax=Steroidobacter sp. TaxID=1978227 RepID=UPI001A42A52F|nr:TonB-dependent receptor [Steroidobacter sp.]MBL8264961.1 TonB-dependent receptor [Steroidobacter sp.]
MSLSGLLVAPASAQEDTGTTRVNGLEEIVVTARKREERLQDTPISLTALTAEVLEQRAVANFRDAAVFAPNVSIGRRGASSTQSSVFIRGIGQPDFTLTSEPGVGIYVDGIYVARSVGSLLDFVDVERVEFMRGPQGTLFGKNAVGGAVSITSRQPGNRLAAQAELTAGNLNRRDAKLAVDVPFSDMVRSRWSFASFNRDGYQDLPYEGGKSGGYERLAARGNILFTPSDALSFNVAVDYTRARDDGNPSTLLAIGDCAPGNLCSPFVAALNARQASLGRPLYTAANWVNPNIDVGNQSFQDVSDTDVFGASLVARWDVSERLSITSLTGFRSLDSYFSADSDGSPIPQLEQQDYYDQDQFSQELQLSGRLLEERLSWLVGAYYFKETGDNVNLLRFGRGIVDFLFPGLFQDDTVPFRSGGDIDNRAWALFTQETFRFTDQLSVTAGVRYSSETKAFLPDDQYVYEMRRRGIPTAIARTGARFWFDPLMQSVEVERDIKEWTPKLSVEYKWLPDFMTYVSYSTGFKSGGFGQRAFPGPNVIVNGVNSPRTAPTFGPETVQVYEVGAKFTGFDNRVRINGAAFYTDYADLQLNFFDGIATRPQNAGDARIQGLELEIEAAPTERLTVNASVGYTDAKLTRLDPNARGVTLRTQLPFVSEWQGGAGVGYEFPVATHSSLTLRADWSYRGAYSADPENNPLIRQRGFGLFNASVVLKPAASWWTLQAGLRNATDERYVLAGGADLTGLGGANVGYSTPREYYLTARFEY